MTAIQFHRNYKFGINQARLVNLVQIVVLSGQASERVFVWLLSVRAGALKLSIRSNYKARLISTKVED